MSVAPALVSARLRIDDLTAADAAALHAYRGDPEVARFQGRFDSVDDARSFIARNASHAFGAHGSWYQLAVRLAPSGELIGDVGVHFVGDDGHQAEIGFTIAPAHQRRGYAVEAVRAVLGHLFVSLERHRVFASVDPENAASIALLKKVGMRKEAHMVQSLRWRGRWVDDVVFAMLRSEWEHEHAAQGAPGSQ